MSPAGDAAGLSFCARIPVKIPRSGLDLPGNVPSFPDDDFAMPHSAPVLPAAHTAGIATWWGGVTSALFWLVLLVAGTMYGGVALAPKVLSWQRTQEIYVAQRYQLVEREEQIDSLERLVTALDQDPQFVAELARLELDTPATGAESISVDDTLVHDPRQVTSSKPAAPFMAVPAWEPWLTVLATQQSLRTGLLTAAAILVIAAFTFLHDGSETRRAMQENRPESVLSVREFWRRRYFRIAAPVVDTEGN